MAQEPVAQQPAKTDGLQVPLLSANGQPLVNTHAKKKNWTGFAQKTLWDWMQLLIIPFVLAIGTLWFNMQQASTSQKMGDQQHASDQKIALDQQHETTLKTFVDDISNLLISHNLRYTKLDDELRVAARAKTFVAMQDMDGGRRGEIIQFLYDSQLIGYIYTNTAKIPVFVKDIIIILYGINAEQANLFHSYLEGADLEGVDLRKANLEGADLRKANLKYTNIVPAQLSQAYSLEDTILPDGSQFPSKSWQIPGRDGKCVQWADGHCMNQQEIKEAPTPPPHP